MCYPKPGPRCSAHASMRLALMKEKKKAAGFGTPEYSYYKEALQQAEQDYDATPAGIQEIKRRLAAEKTSSGELETQMRLDLAIARRKEQLTAIKAVDKGDIKHKMKTRHARTSTFIDSLPKDFTKSHLEATKTDSQTMFGMLTESHEWVRKLTPSEQEAVAWYTSNGPAIFYAHMNGKKNEIWGDDYTPEHLTESIKNLDSALKKYESKTPVVVYRGVGSNSTIPGIEKEDYWDEKNLFKKLKKIYKPGSTYTNPSFMSSSYDPNVAKGFGGIVMEIRTRHAAPVSSVSAWGVSEREAVIPREAEFTVVGVKSVPFKNKRGQLVNVTLLQLEERN